MSGNAHVLLRVHLESMARHHGAPLYEAVVLAAREQGLAGATVLAGRLGYVARGPLLGTHPHALASARPMVIEIVERETVVRAFLETWAPVLRAHAALVTLENARIEAAAGA